MRGTTSVMLPHTTEAAMAILLSRAIFLLACLTAATTTLAPAAALQHCWWCWSTVNWFFLSLPFYSLSLLTTGGLLLLLFCS